MLDGSPSLEALVLAGHLGAGPPGHRAGIPSSRIHPPSRTTTTPTGARVPQRGRDRTDDRAPPGAPLPGAPPALLPGPPLVECRPHSGPPPARIGIEPRALRPPPAARSRPPLIPHWPAAGEPTCRGAPRFGAPLPRRLSGCSIDSAHRAWKPRRVPGVGSPTRSSIPFRGAISRGPGPPRSERASAKFPPASCARLERPTPAGVDAPSVPVRVDRPSPRTLPPLRGARLPRGSLRPASRPRSTT